ncbi:MAG: response regulator [Verrucomicrobia bacterium]|nr:response regulator [Verrucomicrobiota bacterium]
MNTAVVESGESPGIAPLKLLLLEDAPEDAGVIERELRRAELAFVSLRVEGRDDYVRALDEFDPDLVLADYSLPRFSALEALRLLRARPRLVPLILVTEAHSEEAAVECMREGAEDYILKSSLRLLPAAVHRVCRKARAERGRLATEAAFRRSQEQFRLITENTRDLICLVDLDFRFLYVSPSHQAVLGHEPQSLLQQDCLAHIHPDDAPLLHETLDEARFFHASRQAELRFRHREGHWLVFESAVNYIYEENGRPQRALIISRDLSERKRAEKEIRKLAAFPRYNPNPVLEFAADGSLTYFNDAALNMARALKRQHPQAILPLNVSATVKMCLSTGQSRLRLQNTVGGRTLSWSLFPILGAQVVHCYAEDITERLNLENQLRQIQKMESVGQLAAGVAHDFNNILTIIQGHSGLLQSDPALAGEVRDSARQITMAAERAANLTRQLLMFSRKQVMQPHLLDLNDVINNVTKMLRTLLGESIVLERDLHEHLPAVYGDPGMLEQVLVNFAVNSKDAMPHGGRLTIATDAVTLDDAHVQNRTEARPGAFVRLTVTDTGVGMPPKTMSRIFEPFFTTKEIGKGTGLGLATVYGIVKQHQGWVEVESELDKGTAFHVFIPIKSKAPLMAKDVSPVRAPGGRETVLVVEDEPALRELVREILEHKGYTVLEAANGVDALGLWPSAKERIDLLLTDVMMPMGISGRELAQHALAEKPDLKVIYTSGYSLDAFSPDGLVAEGCSFLQKPYAPETLAQVVRDALDAPARSRRSPAPAPA